MFNRIRSFVASVREHGLLNSLRGKLGRSWRHFADRLEERRYGIDTAGRVQLKDVGIDDERFVSYEASRFNHFHQLMRAAQLRSFDGAFLDIGSGKGRAVVLAATYPFRRVIGVEISEQLQSIARQNIEWARGKLACKDIELITADASAYEIPDDVIAIYFFNPFYPSVLSSCLQHIRDSLRRRSRDLTILCLLPNRASSFAKHISQCDWLHPRAELEFEGSFFGIVYSVRP